MADEAVVQWAACMHGRFPSGVTDPEHSTWYEVMTM